MVWTIGSSDYAICICDSQSGDAPAGNKLYLLAESVRGQKQYLYRIKQQPNGVSYDMPDGKRHHKLTINNGIVVKVNEATNTEEFSEFMEAFDGWNNLNAGKLYIFVYNSTDAKYTYLDYDNSTSAKTKRMKGRVMSIDWELKEGNIYYINSLVFERSSL